MTSSSWFPNEVNKPVRLNIGRQKDNKTLTWISSQKEYRSQYRVSVDPVFYNF